MILILCGYLVLKGKKPKLIFTNPTTERQSTTRTVLHPQGTATMTSLACGAYAITHNA